MKVRKNNCIIEAQFKRDEDGQEELIHINVIADEDRYIEGQFYWWQDEPAFPC